MVNPKENDLQRKWNRFNLISIVDYTKILNMGGFNT